MFFGASPEIFERAKRLRENMTPQELALWNRLSSNKLSGLRFKPQHPIDKFIADFYCHKLKLVVEIDGNYHQEEEQKLHDQYREELMKNLGLKVVRFTNEEIENQIDDVIERIKSLTVNLTLSFKTTKKSIYRVNGSRDQMEDTIAIEAPLEIRIKKDGELMGKSIAVTMRTPGNDAELALGFLFTEGILKDFEVVKECVQVEENVIEVDIRSNTEVNLSQSDRNFYTTSSCGVCGKASIDAIQVDSSFTLNSDLTKISESVLFNLQEKLKKEQSAFEATGGIHAAALFDLDGIIQELREDVGRHNALDKLLGASWQAGKMPLSNTILLLSGRASFELVQKANMAGIPFIVAVGAPSSLAIELAEEHQHTLVGFLKSDRFNIYTGHERIER